MTPENFSQGYWVDDECLGGVSAAEDGGFVAYVISHATGEALARARFESVEGAIAALAGLGRAWTFEPFGGCGGGCGEGKECAKGNCGTAACPESCTKFVETKPTPTPALETTAPLGR